MLTQQPSAAGGAETRGEQAARGSGADGGTPTEEERARRHREKKEKKERKVCRSIKVTKPIDRSVEDLCKVD
jgi:hypothetical protein